MAGAYLVGDAAMDGVRIEAADGLGKTKGESAAPSLLLIALNGESLRWLREAAEGGDADFVGEGSTLFGVAAGNNSTTVSLIRLARLMIGLTAFASFLVGDLASAVFSGAVIACGTVEGGAAITPVGDSSGLWLKMGDVAFIGDSIAVEGIFFGVANSFKGAKPMLLNIGLQSRYVCKWFPP